MSDNVFCIAWYENGMECIINLSDIDKEFVMAKIGGHKPPQSVNGILHLLTLRARANAERGMEVWIIKLDESVTEEELVAWSESNAQSLVDTVRANGEKVAGVDADRKKAIV